MNIDSQAQIKAHIRRIEKELCELTRKERTLRSKFSMEILEIQAARETYELQRHWLKGILKQ